MNTAKITIAAATAAALILLASCGGGGDKAPKSGIPETEAAIDKGSGVEPEVSEEPVIPEPEAGRRIDSASFTDPRDGQEYRTVKIGKQVWMARNLNYEPAGGNSWCYGNADSNCTKYGRLYDWNTAKTVCPAGWHLPSRDEWGELAVAAGGTGEYGTYGTAGTKLKSSAGWKSDTTGTDDFGFSALPGGLGNDIGDFYQAGSSGHWWIWQTAVKYGSDQAYHRSMYSGIKSFYDLDGHASKEGVGYSVRCLLGGETKAIEAADSAGIAEAAKAAEDAKAAKAARFAEARFGTFTDPRDGKAYRMVKIGDQVWMARNLDYKTGNSWCYKDDWVDDSKCKKYGRLYDWNTAMKACPKGWRLPSRGDWNKLCRVAGDGRNDDNDEDAKYWSGAAKKLKSESGWVNLEDGRSMGGTDDYGFSALPGGSCGSRLCDSSGLFCFYGYCAPCAPCGTDGSFDEAIGSGYWWTATETEDGKDAYIRFIPPDEYGVYADDADKREGHSVRCLKE